MVIGEANKPLEQRLDGDNEKSTETGIQTRTKYVSTANTLRRKIIDKEYEPFQRLSQEELTNEFHVNKDTLAAALMMLRGEGYILENSNRIYVCDPNSTENSITQLHQIVAYKIRKRIEGGVYKPSERIPTLSDLESDEELDASHVTIVKAIDILKAQGLLVSKRGFGIFVSADYKNIPPQYGK